MRTEITVTEMTCEHCEHAVGDALRGVQNVLAVSVSAVEGRATIDHHEAVDMNALERAVAEAGYTVEA